MPEPERVIVTTSAHHAYSVRISSPDLAASLRATASWLDDHPNVTVLGLAADGGRTPEGDHEISVQLIVDDDFLGALDSAVLDTLATGLTHETLEAPRAGVPPLSYQGLQDAGLVVSPGLTLKAFMQEFNLGAPAVAARCGWREPEGVAYVNAILDGTAEINPEIATSLFIGTNIPSRLWLAVEQVYRRAVAAGAWSSRPPHPAMKESE